MSESTNVVNKSVNENLVQVRGCYNTISKASRNHVQDIKSLFKVLHRFETSSVITKKSVSFRQFLQTELTRGYQLEHDEKRFSARREKIYSFFKIPREVEKFMIYGFFQCADSFLFIYTFLPIRFTLAVWAILTRPLKKYARKNSWQQNEVLLTPAEVCDLLKGIVVVSCWIITCKVDTSMMYHLVKSQSVIKLYIFYNMLEVGDRLFSAFGQDTIDALLWTATEPKSKIHLMHSQHLGTLPHLLFAVIYVLLHSILVLFQATTLNVAINSSNKALLTIMMSNNVKHAFITRFNDLCSIVYQEYTVSLAYDMAQTRQEMAYSDPSDLVARRMGFIPLPLSVAIARVLSSTMSASGKPMNVVLMILVYLILTTMRILINLMTLGPACDLISTHSKSPMIDQKINVEDKVKYNNTFSQKENLSTTTLSNSSLSLNNECNSVRILQKPSEASNIITNSKNAKCQQSNNFLLLPMNVVRAGSEPSLLTQ